MISKERKLEFLLPSEYHDLGSILPSVDRQLRDITVDYPLKSRPVSPG